MAGCYEVQGWDLSILHAHRRLGMTFKCALAKSDEALGCKCHAIEISHKLEGAFLIVRCSRIVS